MTWIPSSAGWLLLILRKTCSLPKLFKKCHVFLVHRLLHSLLLLCLIPLQFQVVFFILLLLVSMKFMLPFFHTFSGFCCLEFGTSGKLDSSLLSTKYGMTLLLSFLHLGHSLLLKLLPSCASLLTLSMILLNMSFSIIAIHLMFLIFMKSPKPSSYPGSHFINLCLPLSNVHAQMISPKTSMLHLMFSRSSISNYLFIPSVPLCMAQLLARTLTKRVRHRGCLRDACIF